MAGDGGRGTRGSLVRLLALLGSVTLSWQVVAALEWAVYPVSWSPEALVTALGLSLVPALVVFVLAAPLVTFTDRIKLFSGNWPNQWLERLVGNSLHGRRVWLGTHAALLLGAVALFPVLFFLTRMASTITDPALASKFIGSAGVLAAGGALAAALLPAALLARFAPARLVASFPVSPSGFFLTAFPLPWLIIPLVVASWYSEPLMPAARLLYPALAMALCCPFYWMSRGLSWKVLAPTAGGLGAVGVGCLILAITGSAFDGQMVPKMPVTSRVFSWMTPLSDRDDDGYLGLFDGQDCDDSDPEIRPMARDYPDNGIDENCDGEDASEEGNTLALGEPELFPFEGARTYNVIWIMVDALRADHLHSYGYKRSVSPNIDRLAEESLLFQNAICQYPSTGISIPSMLTGRYPEYMRWGKPSRKSEYILLKDNRGLPQTLKDAGYNTEAYVSGWVHKNIKGLNRYFQKLVALYPHDEWKEWVRNSSPIAATQAVAAVERLRQKDSPFFLFVHFEDPHEPYVNHDAPGKTFGKSTIDKYDSDINWTDLWVGFFLEYIQQQGLMDDTIIVLCSDHGEEFDDHGKGFHGHQIYQESIHVPLLVRVPEVEPRVIETRVALVDIVPTILDLLGIEEGRDALQGISLLRTAFEERDNRRPIFSMLADREETPTKREKAVLWSKYKLIYDMNTDEVEFYNLEKDPGEKKDLAPDEPPRMNRLLEFLEGYLDASDPSWQQY